MTVQLVVDQGDLLKAEQALTALQAEKFIRPNLEVFGKMVIESADDYPAAGTVLKSSQQYRSERAMARQLGGRALGGLLSSLVSKQGSGPGSSYRRTGEYGRQWKASTQGLNERIENLAAYAGFVGGLDASPGGKGNAKGNQPYTWRYGWKRLKKVAEEVMDEWIAEMERKAFRLWER